MAQYPTLTAATREEFGKGFARRLRRAGKIPGVIYSGHTENVHFAVDRLEFTAVVRNHGSNAIVEFDIDGEKHLTMVKHIDQNVLTFDIDHVDMLAINRDERVEVEVPIVAEGEVFAGAMLIQEADTLLVEADVLSIPEELVVSVEGIEAGNVIAAGDIALPEGVTLANDPELLVFNITFEEVAEVPEEGEEGTEDAVGDAGKDEGTEEGSENDN
ncbi:50S ribosomal protein L25/general stress protein Ctc [Corynebacterium testudinoris]|uniref:Large ribosomal subunit protein bL25 n=1 Tax=Corynebacterium testudinoris TaxID=136857 RepID=A0A0G3H4F3_9CORY|nr:50S ribosomal protein L25/general stress protein Ctc [Corynebacterium testudinoris]AKK08279.1 ribosomal protein L25, Ctc-form [Corynebacterium testudinoris]MBX8995720.1 50S ribosomal protein L25/general stress protein Ctc [Corynebacterium testudinoris]